MKLRIVGAIAVLLLALGIGATSASAAKPKLWLKTEVDERAAPGTAAHVDMEIGECAVDQEAILASNGKAKDKVTVTPAAHLEECIGSKLAGGISSIALTPAGTEEATMTVKDTVELFLQPWCVYAVPKTFSLPPFGLTESTGTVTAALNARASFGPCPTSQTMGVRVTLRDDFFDFPFLAEVS